MIDYAEDLASSLKRSFPSEQDKAERPSSLQLFLEDDLVTDSGRWSLDGHEPFAEILSVLDNAIRKPVPDTELALLKAEQIGATTSIGLGPALHLAADLGKNVGYFLPTNLFAQRIGRTRLKRIIAKSEYLTARMKDVDVVNQMTIKEFDGVFLYLLGLETMTGAISTPLDALLYDEVDLIPAENMEWSTGRVAHSDLRLSVYFSAGYAPGAGIDLRYQEGSQHKWRVDCHSRGCKRAGICLEENFPECLAEIKGHFVRVCPDCQHPLDVVKNGRWVATFPQRAKKRRFSYRLSALSVSAMPADHIMSRWSKCRTKGQKAKFRCAVLAIPDAGAMQPISDVELNRMQSGEVKNLSQGRGSLPRYGGLDAGDLCHLVVYERDPSGEPLLVWVEEIDSDVAFERVSTLIGSLGIVSFVADKKPQTILARALAYRFPQVVALQDFLNGSTLKVVEEEHEKKKYRCAKVDRDESLDETTGGFTDAAKFLRIPDLESAPIMATFATHLKNLRKERSMDAKGRAIDTYLKGVPNHCGMALNSARIAEEIAVERLPWEYTPMPAPSKPGRAARFKRSYC
jgi:Phage terminase large subunit (GpA)